MSKNRKQSNRKRMQGTVVSADMDKTVRVAVDRFVKHPKYLKYVKKSNEFLAHDETGADVGDEVVIEEAAPISKHKTFAVIDNQT
jgi:small subunit ribosomal protein S17